MIECSKGDTSPEKTPPAEEGVNADWDIRPAVSIRLGQYWVNKWGPFTAEVQPIISVDTDAIKEILEAENDVNADTGKGPIIFEADTILPEHPGLSGLYKQGDSRRHPAGTATPLQGGGTYIKVGTMYPQTDELKVYDDIRPTEVHELKHAIDQASDDMIEKDKKFIVGLNRKKKLKTLGHGLLIGGLVTIGFGDEIRDVLSDVLYSQERTSLLQDMLTQGVILEIAVILSVLSRQKSDKRYLAEQLLYNRPTEKRAYGVDGQYAGFSQVIHFGYQKI